MYRDTLLSSFYTKANFQKGLMKNDGEIAEHMGFLFCVVLILTFDFAPENVYSSSTAIIN